MLIRQAGSGAVRPGGLAPPLPRSGRPLRVSGYRCESLVTLDVKCGGCGSYFPISLVVQDGNGYYCKKCLKVHREEQRRDKEYAAKCIFCNKDLRPGDWHTKGGYKYCSECLAKVAGVKEPVTYKCSVCGQLLYPGDTRMVHGGKEYCEKCYRVAFTDGGGEKKYKCSRCGKELGPFEVRMHQGENYCMSCCGEAATEWETAFRKTMLEKNFIVSPKDLEALLERRDKGKLASAEDLKKAPEKKEEKKLDEKAYAETAALFKCLADPSRVKIIESLADHSLSVFAFVDLTGFQYSAVSYHLKMLKEMGIVYSYRDGNFQVYSLTDKGEAVHTFIKKSIELK